MVYRQEFYEVLELLPGRLALGFEKDCQDQTIAEPPKDQNIIKKIVEIPLGCILGTLNKIPFSGIIFEILIA